MNTHIDNNQFKSAQPIGESVIQREFDVEVAGEVVPCVLWTPDDPNTAQALIAMGYGGITFLLDIFRRLFFDE